MGSHGDEARIVNNDIVDTVRAPTPPMRFPSVAPGILVVSGQGVVVEGNRATNSAVAASPDVQMRITFGCGRGLVVNNRIVNEVNRVAIAAAAVAYRDNLTL